MQFHKRPNNSSRFEPKSKLEIGFSNEATRGGAGSKLKIQRNNSQEDTEAALHEITKPNSPTKKRNTSGLMGELQANSGNNHF